MRLPGHGHAGHVNFQLVTRLAILPADSLGQEAIQRAAHQGDLQIEVNLQADHQGQGIERRIGSPRRTPRLGGRQGQVADQGLAARLSGPPSLFN